MSHLQVDNILTGIIIVIVTSSTQCTAPPRRQSTNPYLRVDSDQAGLSTAVSPADDPYEGLGPVVGGVGGEERPAGVPLARVLAALYVNVCTTT